MPHQETLMDHQTGNRRVRVLKTYDRAFAREVLAEMDESARAHLWKSLRLDEEYESGNAPSLNSTEAEDILWDALLEDSREDGNLSSFFVATEGRSNGTNDLYVSPDWPSSEEFAKSTIDEPAARPANFPETGSKLLSKPQPMPEESWLLSPRPLGFRLNLGKEIQYVANTRVVNLRVRDRNPAILVHLPIEARAVGELLEEHFWDSQLRGIKELLVASRPEQGSINFVYGNVISVTEND
ncbi:MAG TPA: hypothetical protein VGR47_03870 [Terracidiphilus sp.]|nr:hypothetical protein [Terracidiphilus sp.]